MADGLTTTTTVSTIPDATKIATDDAGAAGHVQMVKLASPADGSAAALAVATEAKQDTGNTSLSSIDGKITAVNTGAVTVASSALPTGASTLAEQQSQTAVQGAVSGAAVITDANGTIQQYLRGIIKLAITAGGWLVTATLAAGSQIIGKVGIDQTTVGTTDSVTVKSKTVYQRVVYGTAQTVFNSGTDIAAGAFSGAGTDFTNNDATIGACLYADAMIEMPDWAAAPVAGSVVSLWGLMINVDGTDDDSDAPSAAAPGGARYLGSWVIAAADALQRRTITISLAGVQNGFTPYVFNGTAQNMNNDGGTNMVVKITPWTVAQVG